MQSPFSLHFVTVLLMIRSCAGFQYNAMPQSTNESDVACIVMLKLKSCWLVAIVTITPAYLSISVTLDTFLTWRQVEFC